jgi:NTE family protein
LSKRIGLALGGGGARGLAHLGVLRSFKKNNIYLSAICGTSMGAIIGGAFAADPDIKALEEKFKKALSCELFEKMRFASLKGRAPEEKKISGSIFVRARNLFKQGFLKYIENTKQAFFEQGPLEELISIIVPDIQIDKTKIPFSCVATDLANASRKVFKSGSLRRSILASASIPGIFPPIEIDGKYYSDGGAVAPTPVLQLRQMGIDYAVASNVKSILPKWDRIDSAGKILHRYDYIVGISLNEEILKNADLVISPEVRHLHWTDFDKLEMLIAKGEESADNNSFRIKSMTQTTTFFRKVLIFFSRR